MPRPVVSRPPGPTALMVEDEKGSALKDLLKHVVPYELDGAPFPRSLLLFGVIGSALLLTTGLVALVLPPPNAIQASAFFWFEASAAALVVSWMQAIALPAIALGGAMLLVDVYLANGRRSDHWRPVVAVQSVVGNLSGALTAFLLAFVIFIIAVYIVIGIAILIGIGFVLWALLQGSGG